METNDISLTLQVFTPAQDVDYESDLEKLENERDQEDIEIESGLENFDESDSEDFLKELKVEDRKASPLVFTPVKALGTVSVNSPQLVVV